MGTKFCYSRGLRGRHFFALKIAENFGETVSPNLFVSQCMKNTIMNACIAFLERLASVNSSHLIGFMLNLSLDTISSEPKILF